MSLGSNMCELKSSITHSLCDQIFTSPIHWPRATNFSESATHAIDFGLGGLGHGQWETLMVVGYVLLLQVTRVKDMPSFSIRSISSMNRVGSRSGLLAQFVPVTYNFLLSFLLISPFTSKSEIHLDTTFSQLLGKLFHSLFSSSTVLHKALHPFTKSPLAETSA